MPAAAVIPAPIAYIKVVAVKKLVVELWSGAGEGGFVPSLRSERRRSAPDGRALVRALPPTGRSLLLLIEWKYSLGPGKSGGRPRATGTPQGFVEGCLEGGEERKRGSLLFPPLLFFSLLAFVILLDGAPVRLP